MPVSLRVSSRLVWRYAPVLAATFACGSFASAQTDTASAGAASASSATPTLPTPATGAIAPSTGTSAAPVMAVSTDFRLQPGDVLALQVSNHPEMSAPELAVAANGKINLPIVGALTAAGRTLGQIQGSVMGAYKRELRNPQVTLTLVRSVPRQMTLLGAVTHPGPVDVVPGMHLADALAVANGLTVKPGEVKVTLARGKAPLQTLSLETALANPESPANITLKAGDVLNFAPLPLLQISLTGDVVTAGVQTVRLSNEHPIVHVTDVLLAAGGLKNKPEKTHAYLLRNGAKTDLNVPGLFDNNSKTDDLVLKNGDLLSFQSVETKKIGVSVIDLDTVVKNAGNFSFEDQATFSEAIVQAGGLTTPADQVNASIRRGTQTIKVDLQKAALDPASDPALQNGDVLVLAYNPSPKVRLTGTIAKPDMYRLKNGATVMDAVVNAGGLTLKPEQTTLRVLRTATDGTQTTIDVDAAKLFGLNDLTQNIPVANGDLIIAGELKNTRTVYIDGEVTNPGAYELNPGDGLPELMLKAGGPKKTAALSQVVIKSRGSSDKHVDLASALKPGAPPLPITLQTNDWVQIPANTAQVMVLSAVANPGYYPIPENGRLTIGDALLAAGGPRNDAKLRDVVVVRRTAAGTTETKVVPIDAVQKGQLTIDFPLQPGDVVYVPTKSSKLNPLSAVASAMGILGSAVRLGF